MVLWAKIFIAIILGLATTFFCIQYSSFAGIVIFAAVDSLFPAVSMETLNTSTTGGLTSSLHNLAFFLFAILSGAFVTSCLLSVEQKNRKVLFASAVTSLALAFASSTNFWNNERLITYNAQGLIELLLIILALSLSFFLWKLKSNKIYFKVGLAMAVVITIWLGLLLPIFYFFVSLLLAFEWLNLSIQINQFWSSAITGMVGLFVGVVTYRSNIIDKKISSNKRLSSSEG